MGWTFDRYGYELRVNGNSIGTSSSGNWHPNILFDKINGNSSLLIGDLILIHEILKHLREKLEGYLAHKWNLQNLLPSTHPFLNEAPVGEQSLILNGVPNVAGSFNINVLSSNQWGTSDQNFTLNIQAIAPEIQTLPPLQVGSTSAQLRGYLYNIGGENTQVSFEYGTNSLALDSNTTQQIINQNGEVSYLLSGLNKGTTYYYKSWASNSAGISMEMLSLLSLNMTGHYNLLPEEE